LILSQSKILGAMVYDKTIDKHINCNPEILPMKLESTYEKNTGKKFPIIGRNLKKIHI
jgi:hypothetical protein